MENNKYQYKFSLYDFECEHSIVFLHPLKYTEDEFKKICDDCMKFVVMQHVNTTPIPAIAEDREIVCVNKYEHNDRLMVYTSDEYTNFENLFPLFKQELIKLGFEVEKKEIQASYGINQYTHITEHLMDDVNRVLETRIQHECIPTINDVSYDDMVEYVEQNATDVEHAIKLMHEFIELSK